VELVEVRSEARRMRIYFVYRGGYGGVFARDPLEYRVNVPDLPPQEQAEIQALLADSGLVSMSPSPAGAKSVTYSFSLTDRGSTKTHSFDELEVPPAVRPLFAYFQELAIQQRKNV